MVTTDDADGFPLSTSAGGWTLAHVRAPSGLVSSADFTHGTTTFHEVFGRDLTFGEPNDYQFSMGSASPLFRARYCFAAALAFQSACAPPASVPAPRPTTTPAALPDAQVFSPARERCASPAPAPLREPPFETDAALLTVKIGPRGLSLESSGASAGRVLIAIAAATRRTVQVRGSGASVRIYAHVAPRPADSLIDAVAASAGLVVQREDQGLVILDPDEAVRLLRGKRAASFELAPLETRLVPTQHPTEIAPILARLLLGCQGEIISAPRRAALVVKDTAERLNLMEALIQELDRSTPEPFSMETKGGAPRLSTYGVPDATTPSCDAIAPKPAPDLPEGKLFADGAAAGALMRQAARARGKDVVVGCGGDRPAFFHGAEGLDPEALAPSLGLWGLDPPAFTSRAVAFARERLRTTPPGEDAYVLRGFLTQGASELAAVAARTVTSRGAVLPYAPTSMVIAGGSPLDMSLIENLIKAWNEPPASAPGGPPHEAQPGR